MTLYYLEIGEKKKAKETFDFVLKTVGKHSFLGEQVDNSTLKPNWVIGLGWSHAMFIIVLEKLSNIKQFQCDKKGRKKWNKVNGLL